VRGCSCCFARSLDINGEFRTIGFGEPGLVFEVGRNPTAADFPAAAEFVCFKKFWRESNAASVTLTERAVDAHSQRNRGRGFMLVSIHGTSPLWQTAGRHRAGNRHTGPGALRRDFEAGKKVTVVTGEASCAGQRLLTRRPDVSLQKCNAATDQR
jgi:hypothetical protein